MRGRRYAVQVFRFSNKLSENKWVTEAFYRDRNEALEVAKLTRQAGFTHTRVVLRKGRNVA